MRHQNITLELTTLRIPLSLAVWCHLTGELLCWSVWRHSLLSLNLFCSVLKMDFFPFFSSVWLHFQLDFMYFAQALAVAVVQTVLKPMRTVGTEISEFLRAVVKDLPVQWQMVTVVIVFSFFALVLLLTCGYRVKIPFLLAIESTSTLEQVSIGYLLNISALICYIL